MTDEAPKMETSAAADPIAELRQAFVKQAEIIKAQSDKMAAMEKQLSEYAVKMNALSNVPAPVAEQAKADAPKESAEDAAFYAAMREMGMEKPKME